MAQTSLHITIFQNTEDMNLPGLQRKALDMLRNVGTVITLLRPSERTYNPVTGSYSTGIMLQWDTYGVVLRVSKKTSEDDGFEFDDMTMTSMRRVLLGSLDNVEPQQGDTLFFDNAYWRVAEKTTLKPDTKNDLLHICYVQYVGEPSEPPEE